MSDGQHDEEQLRLMAEECILVDTTDKVIGRASKRECHQIENIRKGMLHRAFSVFLFNSKNELMLQQRASCKITFPDCWTNTCCSHPLYREAELEEENAMGVKRAASRKLEHELGIPEGTIKLENMHFLTRIIYEAHNCGEWGEHEIDWILFVKQDVEVHPVANEVRAVKYVTAEGLEEMFQHQEKGKIVLSPWFQMICHQFLYRWWKDVDNIIANKGLYGEEAKDADKIHPVELEGTIL